MEAVDDFAEAVRKDAPYFRRLNPILIELGFRVAADTISPLRVHEFEHVLKNAVYSDCPFCLVTAAKEQVAKERANADNWKGL